MNVLSIILIFIFLGTMVILGAFLVGVGIRRLQQLVQSGSVTGTKTLYVSFDALISVFGLLLVFYGILGTYRLVWGT